MSGEYLFYASIPVLAVSFLLFYRFINGLAEEEREQYLRSSKSRVRVPLALALFVAFFYFSAVEVKALIGGALIVAGLIDAYSVQKRLKQVNFEKRYRSKLTIISAATEIGVVLFLSSYLLQ